MIVRSGATRGGPKRASIDPVVSEDELILNDRIVRLAGKKRCVLAHGVKGVNDRRGGIILEPNVDEPGAKKKGLNCSQWGGATDTTMGYRWFWQNPDFDSELVS